MDHQPLRRPSLVAAGLLALGVLVARHAGANTPPCPYALSTGIATDVATGLTWQSTASATAFGWGAASISCSVLGGAWRLPTVLELQTIVHEGKTMPALSATFSGGVPIDAFFWSSTPSADDPTQAWGVYFDNGNTGTAAVAVAHSVRCVYGG